MAIEEPIEAVVALWDANSLDSTFSGGVWSFQAPDTANAPFVVLVPVDEISTSFTSSRGIERERLQFSIFYEEVAGADPVVALRALGRTLRGVYDNARLARTGSAAGHVMHMRFVNSVMVKESERTYHLAIDYFIARAQAS